MKWGLILCLLLFWPGLAQAQEHSPLDGMSGLRGSHLLSVCERDDKLTGFCLVYIIGFSDGYMIGDLDSGRSQDKNFCLPKGIQGAQKIRVVEKYLKDNPNSLHHGAGILIILALEENFPCDPKDFK
jgi:hypothetical protein